MAEAMGNEGIKNPIHADLSWAHFLSVPWLKPWAIMRRGNSLWRMDSRFRGDDGWAPALARIVLFSYTLLRSQNRRTLYTQCTHMEFIMPATERFALRMEEEEKQNVARLSKKLKVSSSEFVKRAIDHYIRYLTILESETITLTREEFSVLRELMNSNDETNARLVAATKAYRKLQSKKSSGEG